jgi:hypothetical protein
MFTHHFSRGEETLRADSQGSDRRLTAGDTVEATGDAIVHIHGDATRLWAFGRATVHVHGEFDEIYVLGHSNVHIHGKCRKVEVGMHGTAWMQENDAVNLVVVDGHGTVHGGSNAKVRAYGESRVHASDTADVVLHGYSQWHTGSEVRGNLSLYRPGYCVVR